MNYNTHQQSVACLRFVVAVLVTATLVAVVAIASRGARGSEGACHVHGAAVHCH